MARPKVAREVVVFVNSTNWSAKSLPETGELPEHVAWDQWLGPAAERDYSKGYHPAGWRRYWAFGGGTTADMSCHYTDLAPSPPPPCPHGSYSACVLACANLPPPQEPACVAECKALCPQ